MVQAARLIVIFFAFTCLAFADEPEIQPIKMRADGIPLVRNATAREVYWIFDEVLLAECVATGPVPEMKGGRRFTFVVKKVFRSQSGRWQGGEKIYFGAVHSRYRPDNDADEEDVDLTGELFLLARQVSDGSWFIPEPTSQATWRYLTGLPSTRTELPAYLLKNLFSDVSAIKEDARTELRRLSVADYRTANPPIDAFVDDLLKAATAPLQSRSKDYQQHDFRLFGRLLGIVGRNSHAARKLEDWFRLGQPQSNWNRFNSNAERNESLVAAHLMLEGDDGLSWLENFAAEQQKKDFEFPASRMDLPLQDLGKILLEISDFEGCPITAERKKLFLTDHADKLSAVVATHKARAALKPPTLTFSLAPLPGDVLTPGKGPRTIWLEGSHLNAAVWDRHMKLNSWEDITLYGTAKDLSFEQLAVCPAVVRFQFTVPHRFDINWKQLSPQQAQHIGEATTIRKLGLRYCGITDSNLLQMPVLKFVNELELSENSITGHGLAAMSRNKQLGRLILHRCGLTDQGFQSLPPSPSLRVICLAENQIGDESVQHLFNQSGKSLTSIDLSGTDVTADCVQWLVRCPNLHFLNVARTRITAQNIQLVTQLKSLRSLDVGGCGLDEIALSKLRKALPDCKIQTSRFHPMSSLYSGDY